MHVTELEPQGIADQVGEKEDQNVHVIQPEPPLWPDVVSRWCISNMGANFYDRFKNKELMNLFKRLCTQNQQRKFDAL